MWCVLCFLVLLELDEGVCQCVNKVSGNSVKERVFGQTNTSAEDGPLLVSLSSIFLTFFKAIDRNDLVQRMGHHRRGFKNTKQSLQDTTSLITNIYSNVFFL